MGVGNLKLQKPRGPRGWGIYNFENPGDPGGGGLRLSWGFPNPTSVILGQFSSKIHQDTTNFVKPQFLKFSGFCYKIKAMCENCQIKGF